MKITRLLFTSALLSTGVTTAAIAQTRLQLIDPPSAVQASSDASLAKTRTAPIERGQLRTRTAQPNWDTLRALGEALRAAPDAAIGVDVPVFDDKTLALTVDEIETQGETTVFYGHMDGDPLSSAVLVQSQGTFALNVNSGDRAYQVTYRGDHHEAAEIDRTAFSEGPEEPHVPRKTPPAHAELNAKAAGDAIAAADNGSTIDVMVVYSPEARSAAGGTAAMQNQIALAIASTNQAYSNSAMVQRVRLVHTAEVAYTEPSSYFIGDTLDQITDGTGPFSGVNALRNKYGADVVSMLVERGGQYCGIGWLMQSIGSWFAPNAYNVTVRTCATSGGTLAHEMGHNMGLEHDLFVSPEGSDHPVAQRYAHGYYDTVKRFRTIMAYPNGCTAAGASCTRINQFSTPDFLYNGGATGNATTADAARMLDESRVTVANFRASVSTPPTTPTPPAIALGASAYAVSEGAGSVTVTVKRTGIVTAASTVAWATANGSAVAGSDFTAASGTLTFAAGETSKTLSIAIVNDTTFEPAESFTVRLSSPANATLGTATATVTIADNDTAPPAAPGTVRLSAATYSVAENGRTANIVVNRSGNIAAAATVRWSVANGSAVAGTDFGTRGRTTLPSGTISWRANEGAAKTIAVTLMDDTVGESAETFTVTLSSPSAGTTLASPSSATVTINDNDSGGTTPPPGGGAAATELRFAVSRYSTRENAGSLAVIVNRVNLGGGFGAAASVSYATVAGTALAGADFTAVSGTLNWAAGDSSPKTINVPIANDTVVDGAKSFSVVLSGAASPARLGTPSTVTVLIADDERSTR